MAILSKVILIIVLLSLPLVAACAGSGGSVPQLKPSYSNSGGPVYRGPFENPQDDPQFIQMWGDMNGGG